MKNEEDCTKCMNEYGDIILSWKNLEVGIQSCIHHFGYTTYNP